MSLEEGVSENQFEENLAIFAGLLRQQGLPVSTTEMIDAMQALQRIDLSSREEFKSALQATLVKSNRDQPYFKRLFDHFFVPHAVHQQGAQQAAFQKKQFEQKMDQAYSEMQFKGENLQLTPEELAQYSNMPQEQRERLQNFMHRTESGVNVEPRFRPILESLVKSHLRYCRSQHKPEKTENGLSESNQGADEASAGSGAGSGSENNFLREMDIQAIKAADLPEAEQLMQNLSRKLAVQILRRKRSGPRSGPLDLRRSLRDNMRFGGTIFNLKHKPKRRSKQQILLLCDVSGSMKQYSTFVIHFLHGLREVVRDLSCFSFADNLENLTPELKGRAGLQQLLDRAIRSSKNWGGGTNLGFSLNELMQKYPDLLNGRTSVIVVSDTKTISLDRSLKELSKLKDRVKRVIWLNPLPKEQWSDYRSVGSVAEMAEMWPCNTIAQLEEVLNGRL